MKKSLFLTFLSIILFTLAFKFYIEIQNSILDSNGLVYSKISTQVFHSFVFGLNIGSLPILIYLIWKKNKIIEIKIKLISIFIFFTTVSIFIFVKKLTFKFDFQTIESINLPIFFIVSSLIGLFTMFIVLKIIKLKNIF